MSLAMQGTLSSYYWRDDDGYDSSYSEDTVAGNDPQVLSSSLTHYHYEFGRRYHSCRNGAYWGPNDETASELQNVTHNMYWLTIGQRLHLAPIGETPQEILDLGTGTGIWAIHMADKYPSARVTGVDLSPIQPTLVPPNCEFEIDDITLPWLDLEDRYDFIYARELLGSIPDRSELLRQCWRCLKPGGRIEIVEPSVQPISDDGSTDSDHFYALWGHTVIEAGVVSGKSFTVWQDSAQQLTQAGFVNVVEEKYKWPMNKWNTDPKLRELGHLNQLRLHCGIGGYMLRLLTTTLQWSYERAQVFLAEMRASLKHDRSNAYIPIAVVHAQKPVK